MTPLLKKGLGPVFMVLLTLLVTFPGDAPATDYYLDAQQGDDAQSGKSASEAWRSIKHLNTRKFSPGDRILFKKGQIFRGRLQPPSSGTRDNPIVFGPYGQGPKPSLRGSVNFSGRYDWTREGRGLWYLRLIKNPPGVFAHDGLLGRRRSGKTELTEQWDYWYDRLRNRLYVRSSARPTQLAALLEVASQKFVVGPQRADFIRFVGLDMRQARSSTWLGWGCQGAVFKDCSFSQSGENHLQFNNGSKQGRVEGCVFDDWNLFDKLGYAIQAIAKQGGPIDIENCLFKATRPGGGEDHAAIMNDYNSWIRSVRNCRFEGGHGSLADDGVVVWRPASVADEVVIEDNRFLGLGGIAITVQELEHFGAKPKVYIRRNYIQRSALGDDPDKEALRVRAFSAATRVEVSYNIINRTGKGANLHHGIHCRAAIGAKIWNNVVMGADHGLVLSKGSRLIEARNNIFAINRGSGIWVEDGSSLVMEGHNCLFGNGEGPYKGLRGSVSDVLADPRLDRSFALAEESPCRGAGVRLGLTKDFAGNRIGKGVKPDIGAVQTP